MQLRCRKYCDISKYRDISKSRYLFRRYDTISKTTYRYFDISSHHYCVGVSFDSRCNAVMTKTWWLIFWTTLYNEINIHHTCNQLYNARNLEWFRNRPSCATYERKVHMKEKWSGTFWFYISHYSVKVTHSSLAAAVVDQGPDYKKILRLSYDVIITYDNRKSNLR